MPCGVGVGVGVGVGIKVGVGIGVPKQVVGLVGRWLARTVMGLPRSCPVRLGLGLWLDRNCGGGLALGLGLELGQILRNALGCRSRIPWPFALYRPNQDGVDAVSVAVPGAGLTSPYPKPHLQPPTPNP